MSTDCFRKFCFLEIQRGIVSKSFSTKAKATVFIAVVVVVVAVVVYRASSRVKISEPYQAKPRYTSTHASIKAHLPAARR